MGLRVPLRRRERATSTPYFREETGAVGTKRGWLLGRLRRRPRIASLLALVLLIPVASLAAVTGSSAVSSWQARQAAVRVRDNVAAPNSLMAARAVVVEEGLPSVALANAASTGLALPALTRITGFDFAAMARRARAKLDAQAPLHDYPTLAADLAELHRMRPQLDNGTATYAQVYAFFRKLTGDIDAIWKQQLDELQRDIAASPHGSSALAERISLLPTAYALLTTTVDRAAGLNGLIRHDATKDTVERLIAANSAYRANASVLTGRFGPQAAAAWQALQQDAAGARFDQLTTDAVQSALAGKPSPLTGNLASLAKAFSTGQSRFNDLLTVVQAASADVRSLADHEAALATRSFQIAVAVFLFSVLFALATAVLLTRSVVRPLHQLSRTARQVAGGDFAQPVVMPSGPREVAETIRSVDEMTVVLAAVESFTVTLAEDPTSPLLDVPLPGRTGLALQTTLDRLRESVREAERQRVMLHHVATHDGLTGLVNRTAALEAVKRELLRAQRDDSAVMLLYIDLDGLKTINDTYGHKSGDEAIQQAAQALREAARATDVVARLGGDEFLIAGPWTGEQSDAEKVADRLRRAVSAQHLKTDRLTVPLRCSIGIAVSLPGDDVESLIHNADQALYEAKRSGRNRVSFENAIPTPRLPV